MKTIAVISDTHGNRKAIDGLSGVLGECDYIFHLGDTSGDGSYVKSKFLQKTFIINGNCDLAKLGEDELCVKIEGVKIFATHGHLYSAKYTNSKLIARAKELGCGAVLYGHTHRAEEKTENGVLIVNPGTLSRYSRASYAYLVINGDKAVAKIVFPDERSI